MIAITGANGNLGKATIRFLLKKITPGSIIAVVRDPASMREFDVEVRKADYENPDSLNAAFKGAEKLLQISATSMGQEGIRQETNVVRAAMQQEVKHIVYTGSIKPSAQANFYATHQALATERAILSSAITYTFLRNSLYMEIIPLFMGNALEKGHWEYPAGNGKVSFVSRLDIAEALANVLTEKGHENKVYEISGSRAYTFADTARLLNISYADVPNAYLEKGLAAAHLPEELISCMVSMVDGIKANEFSGVEKDLEFLLRRQPLSFENYLSNL